VSMKSPAPQMSPIRQPLLDGDIPCDKPSKHSPTSVAAAEAAAAAATQAASEDAALVDSDERAALAQRLAEGVARLQTFAWVGCAAQVGFVIAKLLARLCALAGSAGDGWFWAAACGAGILAPSAEAWLACAALGETAARHARDRGWTSAAGDAEKRAEGRKATVGDMLLYLRMDWPLILVALSGLTVAAAGEATIPYLYGRILESVTLEGDNVLFHKFMLYLLVTAAITGLATGVRGSTFIVLGSRFSTRLRQALFDQLLRLEVGFYDETKVGDVSSRISADCQKVGDQVELNVNVALRSVIQCILTLAFMYWINWRLASLAFVTVPNVVVASKIFGNYIRKQTSKAQKALAASTAAAEEALGSVRTVKSLHAEAEMSARYAHHMAEYRRLSVNTATAYFPFSALTYTFLPYAASCLVLYYGGKLLHRDQLSSGDLVSFVFYMQSLFATFSSMGNIYGTDFHEKKWMNLARSFSLSIDHACLSMYFMEESARKNRKNHVPQFIMCALPNCQSLFFMHTLVYLVWQWGWCKRLERPTRSTSGSRASRKSPRPLRGKACSRCSAAGPSKCGK